MTPEPAHTERTTLAILAAETRDEHAIKLTETALRGLDATADPVFAAAAELATRTSRR